LGSLQQLAIVVGIFLALLCDYFIAVSAGSAASPWLFNIAAWRWMFWTEIPPAMLYGIGALMIPESPRYLVAQGKEVEAAESNLTQTLNGIYIGWMGSDDSNNLKSSHP
jgi:hypothetical protein